MSVPAAHIEDSPVATPEPIYRLNFRFANRVVSRRPFDLREHVSGQLAGRVCQLKPGTDDFGRAEMVICVEVLEFEPDCPE